MKNKDVIDLINKDGISNTTKQLYTQHDVPQNIKASEAAYRKNIKGVKLQLAYLNKRKQENK